ncbi:hypothetical protein BVRB_6g155240 [Beta vulgaris subsp. vulgaris]|nr:hypothetical protein BVRB_6g155240 [Beta vulgaris subsp. vulgaris]
MKSVLDLLGRHEIEHSGYPEEVVGAKPKISGPENDPKARLLLPKLTVAEMCNESVGHFSGLPCVVGL